MNNIAENRNLDNGVAKLAWNEIAVALRRACTLYQAGDEADAMTMAKSRLPELIGRWSDACGLSATAQKQRLMSLFADEGRRAGEPSLIYKMLHARQTTMDTLNRQARDLLLSGSALRGAIHLREETLPSATYTEDEEEVEIVAV
jgi:hypothetical protein